MTITAFARLTQMRDDIERWKAANGGSPAEAHDGLADAAAARGASLDDETPADHTDDADDERLELRPSLN
jgi:hypothetical protein